VEPTTDPIRLGSILFTLVEPHPGHEAAYNRWYERDHFYSGVMIGPGTLAGKRWVAPRRLKELRVPVDSSVTGGDPMRGSYLATYWILDEHHDEWNSWAYKQVMALHKAKRMFPERDHVHTQLYRYSSGVFRDPDGVPAELALDHPFAGIAVVIGRAADGVPRPDLLDWYATEYLPRALAGSDAAMCLTFTPIPTEVDAPGVARSVDDDTRFLQIYFLDRDPAEGWDRFASHPKELEGAGLGEVLLAAPFIPTVPGTDLYTNELR
jgi:hypothetical protein